MIARHKTDIARLAEPFHELPCEREFCGKRDVHEIACHGDVIGFLREEIGDDPGQNVHVVRACSAPAPVEKAGEPLAREFSQTRSRERPEMGVGNMGQQERHGPSVSGATVSVKPPR